MSFQMKPFLLSLAKATAAATIASVLTFPVSYGAFGLSSGYYWNYHPYDGQSGLGPFVTLLYSFGVSILIGVVVFAVAFLKFRNRSFWERKKSID